MDEKTKKILAWVIGLPTGFILGFVVARAIGL